jgi:hypothetical protein
MTMHLSSKEVVEAVDGTLPIARLEHVQACEACRREVSDLQVLVADVESTADVPEPSPLFWDYFSDRVRAATKAESIPGRASWWQRAWRPFVAIGALTAAVVLAAVLWPARPNDPPAGSTMASAGVDVDPFDDLDEASLTLMTAVASELSWEEARLAALTPRRVIVDAALVQLTPAQVAELARLIRAETGGVE